MSKKDLNSVIGECGYCGKAIFSEKTKSLPLKCQKCSELYHVSCLKGQKPSVLLGDQLWSFRCSFCSPLGEEACSRPNLQWVHVTHLALYNLIVRGRGGRRGFFRWNEDICGFIHAHWNQLMPHRKKTQSWHSTVAGTLSVNCPSVFQSGTSLFNEHGWWSLSSLVPPDPRHVFSTGILNKRTTPTSPSSFVDHPPMKRSRLSLPSVESPLQNTTIANISIHHTNELLNEIPSADHHQLPADSLPQPPEQKKKCDRIVRVTERQESVLLEHLMKLERAVKKSPKVSRLLRKLKIRARQRDYGHTPFDLDQIVSQTLSHTLKYVVDETLPYHEQVVLVYQDPPLMSSVDNLKKDEDICSAFDITPSMVPRGNSVLDQLTLIPVLSRSLPLDYFKFEHYLTGEVSSAPQPFTSPYTARKLKPFIFRSSELTPLKAKLNSEILSTSASKHHVYGLPSTPPTSVDFCYLQEYHMPAVNSLVSQFFWPVDLTECLQYPDFTCVVLFGKLLVGCAFMTPDVKVNEAYISFLLVHPDFQRAGIGRIMLYHLIQSCSGKDVTLHVSVDNPAMLLYQKFGFKAEKFCLDFYERYYPPRHHLSKHAYYMRLRK